MVKQLCHILLFVVVAAHRITILYGYSILSIPEDKSANISESHLDTLIESVFGTNSNKEIIGEDALLNQKTTAINPSEVTQSMIPVTESSHTAEKRDAELKKSSDPDTSLLDDNDNQGCICVPLDECDPQNRTISQDLEGLIDER